MNAEFKIYTKTGDKGETSLIGGTRVPKYHDRIEAYGTLDELNSFIGVVRDQGVDKETRELLCWVQDRVFTAESLLAADPEKSIGKLPLLYDEDITKLEQAIDEMNTHLPELGHFILPGGHPAVSFTHVARCVCRRAERLTIKMVGNNTNTLQGDMVIRFLNRLSDYLFVLARKLTVDMKAEETVWKPRI